MNRKKTFPPYELLPTLVNRVAEQIIAIGDADDRGLGLKGCAHREIWASILSGDRSRAAGSVARRAVSLAGPGHAVAVRRIPQA